jgi:hypothetical protein
MGAVEALSHLGDLSAEQWVTIGAECAADLLFSFGVGKVIGYLKEIDAISKAYSNLTGIANELRAGVDAVLAERPILVTAEGIAIQAPKAAEELLLLESNIQKGGSAVKEVIKDSGKLIKAELSAEQIYGCSCKAMAKEFFKDGYCEVNGFKFTEYYYKKLWEKGRKASTLAAQAILDNAKTIVPDAEKLGFFKYIADGWEMVYNPVTREIHHIQQL